jgi:hypothetical protein
MKKLRLVRVGALIATAALAAGVATSASPASASTAGIGSCTLVAPTKLAITTPYKAVTLRLGADCAANSVDYASWDLYHPTQGWNGITIFDGTSTDIWDVYDWDLKPGSRYSWRAGNAWDVGSNDVAQNQPYTDIKLGSKASLATSRYSKYVTLKTTTSRYSTSTQGYVRWGSVRGTIQYYGAKGWTNLRYAYQNTSGYSAYTVYAPTARSYRVVFPNATTVWGSTSNTSRR